MLTCREIEELLDLYLDQELDTLTRERCAQHLRHCPRCMALLQSKEDEAELIRGCFSTPQLPPDFSNGVMYKLSARTARKQEPQTPRSNILMKFRMVPLIAAALLIFVFVETYSAVFYLFPHKTSRMQEESLTFRITWPPTTMRNCGMTWAALATWTVRTVWTAKQNPNRFPLQSLISHPAICLRVLYRKAALSPAIRGAKRLKNQYFILTATRKQGHLLIYRLQGSLPRRPQQMKRVQPRLRKFLFSLRKTGSIT